MRFFHIGAFVVISHTNTPVGGHVQMQHSSLLPLVDSLTADQSGAVSIAV